MGQPGGISYAQIQRPTPQGLSADAAWGGSYDLDTDNAVINPYSELTGDFGWHAEGEPASDRITLTIDDIPRLAEHLREDWHILAVGFWRDFHPSRYLYTTRDVLAGIINELANDELVDVRRFTDAEATDAEIRRIKAWVAEHGG